MKFVCPPSGFEDVGCVSPWRYQEAVRVRDRLQDAFVALQSLALPAARWKEKLGNIGISDTKSTIMK